MRKTKIVCTIGPASEKKEVLVKMIKAGMNVARINFSHGNFEEQKSKIEAVKAAREEAGLPVALLLDTKGPEIRIGKFGQDKIVLEKGDDFTLVNEEILGNQKRVTVDYKDLYEDVEVGTSILIDDGAIELEVTSIKDKDIHCIVKNGGVVSSRKSANVPGLILNLPSMTEKDKDDIKHGIEAGFDFIAASFIRKPQDVLNIREFLKENGGEDIKIISKIENREGIDNFCEILKVSDGIMVARGDLGVEIPMEEVPIVQKRFIKSCYRAGKPVITATQMLESMINNPRPTRAEVSDIANAVFDVTGAIMLSAESATGKYPVQCVKTMDKIATAVENSIHYWRRFTRRNYDLKEMGHECNMNYTVCTTAMNMEANAIFAYTNTGNTARILSSFSPECPIYAITENEITYRQLALSWNVYPKLFDHQETIDELLTLGMSHVQKEGNVKPGDTVVIAGGPRVVPTHKDKDTINRVIGGVFKI